jgi:hypothetical protein
MTPVWRVLSTAAALVAGFAVPILLLIAFLGVMDMGPVAITALMALAGAVTLLLLFARGRLRI